jgi:hypothetical protein
MKVNEQRQFGFDVGEPALKTLQDLTNLVDGSVAAFEPMLV